MHNIETSDLGDSPAQSPQYEELVEIVTQALARLNIEWPAEIQEVQRKSESDEHFQQSASQPPNRGLPFFQDLHTDVSRS